MKVVEFSGLIYKSVSFPVSLVLTIHSYGHWTKTNGSGTCLKQSTYTVTSKYTCTSHVYTEVSHFIKMIW